MLASDDLPEAISAMRRKTAELHKHIDATEIERLSNIAMYEVAGMPAIARQRASRLFSGAVDEAFTEHLRTRRRFELCLDERFGEAREILKQEFKGQGDFRSDCEKSKHKLWITVSIVIAIPFLLIGAYVAALMYLAAKHVNLC